jgi:hypothetical protein
MAGDDRRRKTLSRGRLAISALISAMLLMAVNCGPVVHTLGELIGAEDSTVARLIAGAAVAGTHSAAALEAATRGAGSKIEHLSIDLLGESGSATAKRALTDVTCQTIASAVQTGKWPTTVDVASDAFQTVRGEVQHGYSEAEITASVLSLAQSIWTGNMVDDDAVRNVVCAGVGAGF